MERLNINYAIDIRDSTSDPATALSRSRPCMKKEYSIITDSEGWTNTSPHLSNNIAKIALFPDTSQTGHRLMDQREESILNAFDRE